MVVLAVVAVVRGDVAAVAAAVCDGFLRAISQPHHRTAAACATVTPLTPVSSFRLQSAVAAASGSVPTDEIGPAVRGLCN